MGYYLLIWVSILNQLKIMKAKIFIAIAGIALFAACKGRNGYEDAKMGSADTVGLTGDSIGNAKAPKLVKTADMNFKVKNVQQAGDSISALTARYNGMVMHHKMGSTVENSQDIRKSKDSILQVSVLYTTAEMTLKIPSEKLEDFMTRVSHMTTRISSRQMDVDDKSLDYLAAQLKVKNKKEFINNQKDKSALKNANAVLGVKDNMVDEQINNQRTNDAVRYSVITLSFFENNTVNKEVIANTDPSAYQLPFFDRLLMALANGWSIFTELLIGIANLWIFILVGIGLWMLFRLYKKKYPAL
jgi:hypothetical protein